MAYPATPKTWVAGDVLTAAQLNAELRNALLGAFPLGPPDVAWTAYTPTLTQSATVTKTVTYAKYTRVGRMIVVEGHLAVTGAGTAANGISIGLPVTAATSTGLMLPGGGYVFDTSASLTYPGFPFISTTTTLALQPAGVTIGVGWNGLGLGGGVGTGTFGAALASGDQVAFSAIYESAT